jgi:prepilin-type N-terminal cleavage/methylation domain-containing protein
MITFAPHRTSRRDTSGFTLIELLVVISIIGLLSAIVLASLNTARVKSRDARRLSDMNAVVQALQLYYTDNASYPLTPGTDTAAACGGSTPSCVDDLTPLTTGSYISTLPIDPTRGGSTINYRYCSTAGKSYVILEDPESLNNWCMPQEPVIPDAGCGWSNLGPAGGPTPSC